MSQQRGNKRLLLAGSAVAAGVLLLGSAAWGCAAFKGRMVVQGNRSTGLVTSIGTGGAMTWCAGYPLGKAKATLGGSVTVTMSKAPWDSCSPGNRLSAGTYLVNYANGAAFDRSDPKDKSNADGTRTWNIDCAGAHSVSVGQVVTLGTMEINSLGKGSGTYTLPTSGVVSGPTDEAAVCVTDAMGNNGNQAPVTIV